ncbi:putative CONSTANS-like zinc finger protein [Quillaja saponaria]|uniref:CONSTANS-like zinc finger protein n=1 Tax=Quillaja saponaria TaxID=32244 RepID=A0AAD7VMC4_QUISA|nr:putative CONSTANS-like zinc finger protein [Quillaja saponaria]
MEPLCEFCGVVRAVVYCKSDSARICLHCDGCVHSANLLSHRHQRSLLCDKCNSQPAIVRYVDVKLSVCQGCDWNGNGGSVLGHGRQALKYYTGCPSLEELSSLWSSALDAPSSSSFDWGSVGSLPINDNCTSSCLDQRDNEGLFSLVTSKLNDIEPLGNFDPLMGQSSMTVPPNPSYMPFCREQPPLFPEDLNLPKGCSAFKDLGIDDGDDLCDGLNIDDVPLNFESDDEIFGCSQGPSRFQCNNGGIDCPESNGPAENASSSGQQYCVTFQSSRIGGSASMIRALSGNSNCLLMNPSCNRNINLGFPPGKIQSSMSLSLSNITGESCAADYQDCGLSPAFLTREPPWESKLEASCPASKG